MHSFSCASPLSVMQQNIVEVEIGDPMKANEIIRIIIFSLIGFIIIFLAQPFLYTSRILRISDINTDVGTWINNYYIFGAGVVFAVSVLSTIIWYLITANAKAHKAEEVAQWMLVWWLFLLFPILGICVAIGFFKGDSNDALGSLAIFFVFDILLLFWLPTATSTPGGLKYVPPGSIQLRRFFNE